MSDSYQFPPVMKDYFIVISDMWNMHWCRSASINVGILANQINTFIAAARDKQALIIHAPSECMEHYKDSPARKRAIEASAKAPVTPDKTAPASMPIEHGPWDGCPDSLPCPAPKLPTDAKPWTQQIASIHIDEDKDAISDNLDEIWGLINKAGAKRSRAIMMGVHLNECVLSTRDFSLKTLVKLKRHQHLEEVMLIKDLSDTMYDPRNEPLIQHYAANDIMVRFISDTFAGDVLTVGSSALLGGSDFRFPADARPSLPETWTQSDGVLLKCMGNEGKLRYLKVINNRSLALVESAALATRWFFEEIGPSVCIVRADLGSVLDGNPVDGGTEMSNTTFEKSGTRWYVHVLPPYEGGAVPGPTSCWLQCCGRYGGDHITGQKRFLNGNPHNGKIESLAQTPIVHSGCEWAVELV
jgi:nicotinamidase-related amidase